MTFKSRYIHVFSRKCFGKCLQNAAILFRCWCVKNDDYKIKSPLPNEHPSVIPEVPIQSMASPLWFSPVLIPCQHPVPAASVLMVSLSYCRVTSNGGSGGIMEPGTEAYEFEVMRAAPARQQSYACKFHLILSRDILTKMLDHTRFCFFGMWQVTSLCKATSCGLAQSIPESHIYVYRI